LCSVHQANLPLSVRLREAARVIVGLHPEASPGELAQMLWLGVTDSGWAVTSTERATAQSMIQRSTG
jgi:hypothetical protein